MHHPLCHGEQRTEEEDARRNADMSGSQIETANVAMSCHPDLRATQLMHKGHGLLPACPLLLSISFKAGSSPSNNRTSACCLPPAGGAVVLQRLHRQ